MISVYDVVHKFCMHNNLPAPSKNDLSSCGNIISHHFKKYWAPGIYKPGELIKDAGFMYTKERGSAVIVNGYPDMFLAQMMERIMLFYDTKASNIEKTKKEQGGKSKENDSMPPPGPVEPIIKRKRIPAGSQKVHSTKSK